MAKCRVPLVPFVQPHQEAGRDPPTLAVDRDIAPSRRVVQVSLDDLTGREVDAAKRNTRIKVMECHHGLGSL